MGRYKYGLCPRKPQKEVHSAMANEVERRTIPVWPDAARILGLGRNAAYEAVARGDIPAIRIGRKILVPKAALDRLLKLEAAV